MIRALLVLPLALIAAHAGASDVTACCGGFGHAWTEHAFAGCRLNATCAPEEARIAVTYSDRPACPSGSYACHVSAAKQCCIWSCEEAPDCSKPSPPSCCAGYCGFGKREHVPPFRPLPPDPACSGAPTEAPACCTDTAIVASGSLQMAPAEWAVSFGYRVK